MEHPIVSRILQKFDKMKHIRLLERNRTGQSGREIRFRKMSPKCERHKRQSLTIICLIFYSCIRIESQSDIMLRNVA